MKAVFDLEKQVMVFQLSNSREVPLEGTKCEFVSFDSEIQMNCLIERTARGEHQAKRDASSCP